MFFSSATHYYTVGRFAAFTRLAPVVGNLLHHAIEMYLKGGLSETKTLAELKTLSHDLPGVWSAFKVEFPDPSLAQFDGTITALHMFEELRYPDSVLAKGMACRVSIKRSPATAGAAGATTSFPQYDLCLEDIDALVAAIFKVVSVNPQFFTGGLSGPARQWLKEENGEGGLTTG